MIPAFFKNKAFIYIFASDVFVLTGVIFWNWNSARIIGFYWLDVMIMLGFFMLFMKWIHVLDFYIDVIFGFGVLLLMMMFYLIIIAIIAKEIGFSVEQAHPEMLFYPYYDTVFFSILCGIGHLQKTRELYKAEDRESAKYYQMYSSMFGILLIPAIMLGSVFIGIFFRKDANIPIILSLLIFKNILEWWRFRKLNKIVSHTSPTDISGV